MPARPILLLFLLLFPALLWGQGSLRIRVTDADSHTGVEAAAVGVFAPGSKTLLGSGTTDEQGETLIPVTGPCRVEVSALGYEPVIQMVRNVPASGLVPISLTRRLTYMEESVVTGVTVPVKIQDALSQYRIITNAQIRAQGAITLADALPYQLNTNISTDQQTGARINMQGLSGDKVKILVDGLPVNGREAGNIDLNQINLNNAERIEIIQGPMSVVYGSDALGGVVNVITRKNLKPLEIGAQVNYESIGKYNLSANAGMKLNKRHGLLISGGRNYFQGWYDMDTTAPKRRLLWKPKEQYFGNIAYNYTAPSGFRLQLASDYLDEKVTNRGIAKVTPYFANARDEYYYNKRSMNRLILMGKLGHSGQWQMQNGFASYRRLRKVVFKDLVTLQEVMAPASEGQDTTVFRDFNLRGSYGNLWRKLTYSAGYDINLQYGESGKIAAGKGDIADYAVFGTASYPLLHDQLTLQAGLRAAHNTRYAAPVIPSFNVLYTPLKKVQVRASYARGFRAPSLKEMYLEFVDNNHHIIGNTDLQPEEGDHFQASASWQLYEKGNTFAQIVFTGFYNDITNQIGLVNLHPDQPNNIDYTYGNFSRMKNVIGNVQGELQHNNWQLTAGFSYNHTYPVKGLVGAYDVYEINGSLQYYFPLIRTSFNAFIKYTGDMPQFTESVGGDITYSGKLPDYSMIDLSASRKFWKSRIQLIAGVKNILDVQVLTPSGGGMGFGTPGGHTTGSGVSFLPRRFFTTLRYTF